MHSSMLNAEQADLHAQMSMGPSHLGPNVSNYGLPPSLGGPQQVAPNMLCPGVMAQGTNSQTTSSAQAAHQLTSLSSGLSSSMASPSSSGLHDPTNPLHQPLRLPELNSLKHGMLSGLNYHL
ncbi:unnamed protein product [Auanema sp. JU1783]|nr:unnamed protein product [Auanema sp. JU1783]